MASISHNVAEDLTALTIDIESLNLTTSQYSAVSSAITNAYSLYCDFWLELASITPTAGGYAALYIIPSVDGTNYPVTNAKGAVSPGEAFFAAAMPFAAAGASAQKTAAISVPIPARNFKVIIANFSGTTWSTGNTLKYSRHNLSVA